MSHMPEEALELALNLLSVQRPEGNAMHQYAPLALAEDNGNEANAGDSREKKGVLDEHGKPADTRSPDQKRSMLKLLEDLKKDYPKALNVGHNTFSSKAYP
jgi:hypothetical protein